MSDLEPLLERVKASEYFSGVRLADDLERLLAEQGDGCRELGRELRRARHLYLVGSGGSLATLQTARYILDGFLKMPCEAVHGYDLLWRKPLALGSESVAFFASYSGETEDTVAALRFAHERGARTVGIVRGGDSTLISALGERRRDDDLSERTSLSHAEEERPLAADRLRDVSSSPTPRDR
jgi:hypothetical protein